METKIEDFNWNLRLFLDVINSYQTSVNTANPSTLLLLEKTLDKIGDLIENVDEVEASQNDAIQCTFDEHIFEVKRKMFCHICKVDFEASRLNHLLHLADPKHNVKLINNKQGGGDASITNSAFTDSNNNAGKTESLPLKNGVQNPTQQYSLQSMLENHRLERAKVGTTSNNVAANGTAITGTDALNANNEAKIEMTTTQKATAPKVIPNVFDDGIYDFIESIAKSDVCLPKKSLNENEAATVGNIKHGFHKENSTVSAENELTWRHRPNELRQANSAQQTEIRRLDKSNELIVRHETYTGPPIFYHNSNMYATPMMQAQPTVGRNPMGPMVPPPNVVGQQPPTTPMPLTQSIIQNGAMFTGFGVKPCPTYELNNLYLKFPHLNQKKVTNPLKFAPLDKRSFGATKHGDNAAKPAGGLQDLFNKINKENQLKKSESTNSLNSLPSFGKKNAAQNQAKYRLPERSASSLNLTGITRMDGANPQKANRRSQPSVGQNGQSKQQWNGQSGNGPAKVPLAPLNDPKNKGAIPKHSTQISSSNGKKFVSNDVSKTSAVQNAQKKDVKSAEQPKLTETAESKSSPADLINDAKLKRFFTSDLSALINLMVEQNIRVSKSSLQEKLIEAVEKTLKEKFRTLKCHVIGSHSYNIVKGGRAPWDIYLDLCDSFHTDKSGPIIINGMNEALKLFEKSGDWSDAKCSEQSRYGILSASYKPTEWKCNFTFGTGVAVRNSDIIGSLFDVQPVARQLVISVRLALQEGASGDWAKHFTGYVVTLLVIFYLQTTNKLPKIVDLQSNSNYLKCGENLVHFSKPTNVVICKDRIRDLLIGFFEFYGKFDFFNNIISPYEGREINQMFRNHAVDSLSRSMRRFKSLIDSEPKRWTNNRMCIQDIFEHKRNVGAAIDAKETKAFKALCVKCFEAIHDAGNGVKY